MPIQSVENEVQFRMPDGEIVTLVALIRAEMKPQRSALSKSEVRDLILAARDEMIAAGPAQAERLAALKIWLDANPVR